MRTMQSHLAVAVALIAVVAGTVVAGPLNPPAGPIASTYKTLAEVEPRRAIGPLTTPGDADSAYRISQAGSYYLTGNIQNLTNRNTIEIAASNVTIDLGGFVISGGAKGLAIESDVYDAITIRNGTITNCSGHGIDLQGVYDSRVENVRVRSCGGKGMIVGARSTLAECHVSGCAQGGIGTFPGTILRSCTVAACTTYGFSFSGDTRYIDCHSRDNSGDGFTSGGSGALLTGCVAHRNGGDGFSVGSRTTLDGCTATENEGLGYIVGDSGTIRECAAHNNGAQGIRAANFCTVQANQCRGNGVNGAAAGLWAEGSGNRIEDNEATGNDFGIFISGTDNIVIRNSARANPQGNFVLPANNEAAPVITNPGSNGFATATPWSNFAY